jgi:hypothetical protein
MDSLREHGRSAAVIVLGSVCMLFIAGGIEGVFRQTVTSIPIRFTVAGATAAWWIYYFGFVGRARDRRDAAEREAVQGRPQPRGSVRELAPQMSGQMEVAR